MNTRRKQNEIKNRSKEEIIMWINWHQDQQHHTVYYCPKCKKQRVFNGNKYGMFTCTRCQFQYKYNKYHKKMVIA